MGNVIYNQTRHGFFVNSAVVNAVIWHNTIDSSARNGIFIQDQTGGGHDVRNNIVSVSGEWGIVGQNNFALLSHNAYFANTAGACQNCPAETGSVSADPEYISAADADFRLRSTSPCKDAATPGGVDTNGSAPGEYHGDAPDIGALEATDE